MNRSFEEAKAALVDTPRPSLKEFIDYGKNNFVLLALMLGEGFVVQAVEIAEALLEERDVCSECEMPYCECDEYE